jgi:hypothetical protein
MKIALVGCGRHMRQVLLPSLRRHTATLDRIVCVDSNLAAARNLAESLGTAQPFKTIEELGTETFDRIIIAVYPEVQADLLSRLIGRAPHILVEKPAALDAGNFSALQKMSTQTNSCVQVGFNFRFCAGALRFRPDPLISQVNYQATFLSKHPLATGLTLPASIQYWLKVNGVHMIDLLFHLGGPIEVLGVRSQPIRQDRFLLQVDAMVGGAQSSLLLGNLASKFTMHLSAVAEDGSVMRMLDPSRPAEMVGLQMPDRLAVADASDRLATLGYVDELGVLAGR